MEDGRKQPFYIKPANEETFAFAALWDKSITPGGEAIVSCAVITMPANELLRDIHNSKFRMPAILKHEHIETWLSGTAEEARAVLLPYPSDEMIAWPVSTRVNTPKNDGPDLIQPWHGRRSTVALLQRRAAGHAALSIRTTTIRLDRHIRYVEHGACAHRLPRRRRSGSVRGAMPRLQACRMAA